MSKFLSIIPYGKQHITQDDIDAVVAVLKSDYLTQGPAVKAFEDAFAEYIGSKYAVAVSNGTAALHLCTLALNVQPGDKVITTPITFAASANCVRYCGGEVVFFDIDPETYLLDIKEVRKLLEASPKGTYKGIIPVDFAGRPVDMEAFRKLADEFDCWIIEDACHAPGGYFYDSKGTRQNCGNGNYADLAIFSFHPVKHIAAGEGGMITTNNEELYHKLLTLRTHGITKNQEEFQNPKHVSYGLEESDSQLSSPASPAGRLNSYPLWYMEMQTLGYNYRLSDIQAALGLSQLQRAEAGIKRRREIAKKYQEAFEGKPWLHGQSGHIEGHAYHLYVIEVADRAGLYKHLREKGIYSQVHYIPLHLMPYYREQDWQVGDFPHSEKYYYRCISLPMYPTMATDEQNFVLEIINDFYEK